MLPSPYWQILSLRTIFKEPGVQTPIVPSQEVLILINAFYEIELFLYE